MKFWQRKKHHQLPGPNLGSFDEDFYVNYYDDISRAVAEGRFSSGLEHYTSYGWMEGRDAFYDPAAQLKRKIGGAVRPTGIDVLRELGRRLEPINVEVDPSRGPVVNVFIPTMDPAIMFGGYIAFFHFLCRLQEAGVRLRFLVREDPQSSLRWFLYNNANRPRWVAAFTDAAFHNISPDHPDRTDTLKISEDDGVVVYSCWMAHACMPLVRKIKSGKFLFFSQEDESSFHHYDAFRFTVEAAYDLSHVPIFNSKALHDYFRQRDIGVFRHTKEDQLFFEHVIPAQETPPRNRDSKRFLFYARPEAHAARNLFEIGILALRECVKRGTIDSDWELVGIGGADEYSIDIADGVRMNILPRVPQDEYEDFLTGFRAGLSLMSAPHPGVVHFEWAARGIPTVVNTTRERDAEYYQKYGRYIVAAEASIDGIADGIEKAIDLPEFDKPGFDGSQFSGSWDEAFSPSLIKKAIAAMGSGAGLTGGGGART